ncbi:MAG: DUF5063 domain-containing protein [Candidatus Acidiferrum sp.]
MSVDLSVMLHRFRAMSAIFIEVVDSAPNLERDEFLASLNRALAELYSSALYLPAAEPETADVDAAPFASDEFVALRDSLQRKFGPLDIYWGTFDSTEKSEPYQGSLAGDISEIYFDLKENRQLGEKGITRADLIWELRESFREHWGRHAAGALKAIYDLHL